MHSQNLRERQPVHCRILRERPRVHTVFKRGPVQCSHRLTCALLRACAGALSTSLQSAAAWVAAWLPGAHGAHGAGFLCRQLLRSPPLSGQQHQRRGFLARAPPPARRETHRSRRPCCVGMLTTELSASPLHLPSHSRPVFTWPPLLTLPGECPCAHASAGLGFKVCLGRRQRIGGG